VVASWNIISCGEVTRKLPTCQGKRGQSLPFPAPKGKKVRSQSEKQDDGKQKKLNSGLKSPKNLDYRLRYMTLFSTFATR